MIKTVVKIVVSIFILAVIIFVWTVFFNSGNNKIAADKVLEDIKEPGLEASQDQSPIVALEQEDKAQNKTKEAMNNKEERSAAYQKNLGQVLGEAEEANNFPGLREENNDDTVNKEKEESKNTNNSGGVSTSFTIVR